MPAPVRLDSAHPVTIRISRAPMTQAVASLTGALFPLPERRPTVSPMADEAVVAVAERDGQHLGAALAHVRPDHGVGEVLSLAVHPGSRRQGIGTALLGGVERGLAGATSVVQGVWRSDWSSASAVERMLWKAGWDAPREHKLLSKGDASMRELPLYSDAQAPPGYAVLNWGTITPDDRAHVARLVAEDPAATDVDPFKDDSASPTISVWLRHAASGQIVGWMRTVRHDDELVEYAGLYIAPGHRSGATAQALIADALRRHDAEKAGGTPRGVFAIAPKNRLMRTLARRWFGDHGAVRATVWQAGHRLTPSAP